MLFNFWLKAESLVRGNSDKKKSILKRSSEGGGGGGCGAGTAGSTSGGALSDQDQETEKLIGGEGATASESGSEPFSPVAIQRRAPSSKGGWSSARSGETLPLQQQALGDGSEEWHYADYSPTEDPDQTETSTA